MLGEEVALRRTRHSHWHPAGERRALWRGIISRRRRGGNFVEIRHALDRAELDRVVQAMKAQGIDAQLIEYPDMPRPGDFGETAVRVRSQDTEKALALLEGEPSRGERDA